MSFPGHAHKGEVAIFSAALFRRADGIRHMLHKKKPLGMPKRLILS